VSHHHRDCHMLAKNKTWEKSEKNNFLLVRTNIFLGKNICFQFCVYLQMMKVIVVFFKPWLNDNRTEMIQLYYSVEIHTL